jgi:hypothetical protein
MQNLWWWLILELSLLHRWGIQNSHSGMHMHCWWIEDLQSKMRGLTWSQPLQIEWIGTYLATYLFRELHDLQCLNLTLHPVLTEFLHALRLVCRKMPRLHHCQWQYLRRSSWHFSKWEECLLITLRFKVPIQWILRFQPIDEWYSYRSAIRIPE